MNPETHPRYFPLALILAGASVVATALAVPYLVVLVPKLRHASVPLPAVATLISIQAGIQVLLFSWAGLRLGSRVKLGAPYLRAWVERRGATPAAHWWAAAGTGVLFGAVLSTLDRFVLLPMQPEALRVLSTQVQAWRGFLASFYGGIVEESLVRLFVMTAFVWGLAKLVPRQPSWIFLVAVVTSAVVFALAHLPAAAKIAPLDTVVVSRVLLMNSAAGIVFGLVYWRWGLEHAMLCHFCADVVLHSGGG